MKILFISQTYTSAVAISFRQSLTRTRNLVKYHPRVVFTESFHAMVSTDEDVCSPCERYHFLIQHLDSFSHTLFSCKASCKHSIFVSAQEFLTHFDGY